MKYLVKTETREVAEFRFYDDAMLFAYHARTHNNRKYTVLEKVGRNYIERDNFLP